MDSPNLHDPSSVLPVSALDIDALCAVFAPYGLALREVEDGAAIPGSYWGDSEAGLIGNTLYMRPDTPVHSVLHEGCHFLCMDASRREALHTDAGGMDAEEHAVCFLQCVLAERLPGYSRERCFADMDAWGYHFMLGSARAWFERDSHDEQAWLREHGFAGLLDSVA